MQLRHALTTALLALCCADNVLGRNVLRPRQEDGQVASTTPAPTDDGATASNTSPVSSATPTETSEKTKSTKDNVKTTTSGGATHVLTTSKPSATAAAGSKNATETEDNKDELPLTPIITPAVGLAGAILMITGVAYTIIGIKHKWLLVFLSAAYLASLSITVLIIYVMSPPVSDAIQGAYFVAAFFTGVIFGGISLVFKEVTEGFGCIVGGFCLAMWFLVLKPGGLIESTTGRAIMIGAFSAVGWSLAFSQYTRTYGTIICTSFGGAMITMLGIDCFSRAGLKEFWIYIWALNDAEFPIHTNTYPITRGIRVEIAGTVVLCLFGIMSQIKVWKIVKERKLKSEAVRLQDDKKRELRDSKIGKRVEQNNERSLARWEALYGNSGRNEDSSTGTDDSDAKKSSSVAEREIGSIEMDDMSSVPGDRSSKQIRHSVMEVVPEQETPKPELQLDINQHENDYGWWTEDFRSAKTQSNAPSVTEGSLAEMIPSPTAPPVPQVPYMEAPPTPKEEVKSEEDKPVHERRGIPLDALGLQKLNAQQAPAALPRIEDDRASSVAATLDDEPEMNVNRLSVAPSLYQTDGVEKGGLSPFSDEFKVEDKARGQSPARTPGTETETPVLEDDDDEVLVRPPTADAEAGASRVRWGEAKRDSQSKSPGIEEEPEEKSESEKAPSIHSLREERLPESISKVAMAYRTNEWAKHIADAPEPDMEEEPQGEVEEASVQVEYQRPATATEKPRSVDPEALLATGAPQVKSPKQGSNPYRQPSKDGKARRHSNNATPVYAFQRTNSDQSQSQSLQRQGSSNSMHQGQPKLDRKTSQPLSNQILVESPIEEAASSQYETPLGSTLNLLDARNSRLDNRMTTTSFNALNVPTSTTPLSETGTGTSSQENLPLSQRKDLIDQGVIRPMSPPQKAKVRHSGTTPNILRSASSSNQQNLIYDSHQPRRSHTVDTRKQSQMLSQWRQSLQAETSQTPTTMLEEQARMQMIMQQRHAEHQSRKKEREREGRERERDVAMRTSMLAGAHQDALRRMQAKADTGLGGGQKK